MLSTSEAHASTLPKLSSADSGTDLHRPIPSVLQPPSSAARLILLVVAGFSLLGTCFALWLRTLAIGHPDPRLAFNVFFLLFGRHEPAGLLVVVLFSLGAALIFLRSGTRLDRNVDLPRWLCPIAAVFVFAITAFGTQLVFHDYLLTADENLADFQARIFLHGKIQAEVPSTWVDTVRVIRPTFVDYFPVTHSWNATYFPVYAAMRAAFQSVDLQWLLNPILAALTVFAVYGTARNIWPESKNNALIAVGLLVGSSQFLIMSMTSYAMPAHLALNSVWLWLYSRPQLRRFYLAPFIGVLAIGLHQPIVHALFALPFLARLLFQRRWRAVFVFGSIYVAGCILWYLWRKHFQGVSAGGAKSIFNFLNPRIPIIQSMNLLLIIAWASLAIPLLALLGLTQFRRLRPIAQDAAISCVLTFIFYFGFYLDQAHGWGYRYFHGVIICLIIVGVSGFNRLSIMIGERRAFNFVFAATLFSIFVQLPLRCFQAEAFVRPYARATEVLHAIPADIVALDPRDAWYSADLIRNDPFLERKPVMVSLYGVTEAGATALGKNGRARFISRDELARLGMFTDRPNPDDYANDPFKLGRGR